jgi:hypothetical protein
MTGGTPQQLPDMTGGTPQIDAFIARWQGQQGGQERANYALFLTELCDVLGVPRPDPAAASTEDNDYVFERAVQRQAVDGTHGLGRIDLYKRGCFVLEAKQSRQPGAAKALGVQYLPGLEPPKRGVRDASRTWDVLMLNARRQAEGYARALPVAHGWPPFILVCDVGHVIGTYADFSGQGKNYAQFPDRQSFRVYLEDLRRPEIRERLARIWTDPLHLDPARETARVTRTIAERLAAVSGLRRTSAPLPGNDRKGGRVVLPRIKDGGAAIAHIAHVPGGQIEVMVQRGCGKQRINDRRRVAGIAPHGAADGAPAAHDRVGYGKQPQREPCRQTVARRRVNGPAWIAVRQSGDAFVVFGDGENAEMERCLVLAGGPRLHAGGAACAYDLCGDVGIQQPADQSAMSRPRSRSRVRSSPSTLRLSMKATNGTASLAGGSRRSSSSAAMTTTAS